MVVIGYLAPHALWADLNGSDSLVQGRSQDFRSGGGAKVWRALLPMETQLGVRGAQRPRSSENFLN